MKHTMRSPRLFFKREDQAQHSLCAPPSFFLSSLPPSLCLSFFLSASFLQGCLRRLPTPALIFALPLHSSSVFLPSASSFARMECLRSKEQTCNIPGARPNTLRRACSERCALRLCVILAPACNNKYCPFPFSFSPFLLPPLLLILPLSSNPPNYFIIDQHYFLVITNGKYSWRPKSR